jgi:hypothetical protein
MQHPPFATDGYRLAESLSVVARGRHDNIANVAFPDVAPGDVYLAPVVDRDRRPTARTGTLGYPDIR